MQTHGDGNYSHCLTEKKLFSCTNSTVIEDWNVTHRVEIKTVSFFQ